MKARVTYDYASAQVIQVKAINTDQKRIMDSRGESVANPVVIAQDDFSPLKVSMAKGPAPLVVDPSDAGDATYRLEIANVGNGWPITFNEIGLVRGTMSVNGPGISLGECSAGSGNFNQNGATLRSDGKAPVICTLIIDKSRWTGGPREDSFLFSIDLRYKYFVEKTAAVTVHGKASSGSSSPGSPGTPPGGSAPQPNQPPGGTNNACGSSYTVQSGDTLSNVALRCYGDANKWSCICSANGLSDCDVIYPGQILTLSVC